MYTFDGNWNKRNITFNLLYTKTRFIDQSFSHSGPDVIFRHIGTTKSSADEIANFLQHLFYNIIVHVHLYAVLPGSYQIW